MKKRKPMSDETKAKISAKMKGRKVSEEAKQKMRKPRGPMSDETKAKISASIKNNTNHGAWNKGKKTGPMSDETKAKISKSSLGRKHTPETKEKIRISRFKTSKPVNELTFPPEFKEIPERRYYGVSKDGRVWSKISERVLKPQTIGGSKDHRYHAVCIAKDGAKSKFEYVHRLVGLTYIPNPKNKPQINHKDFDTQNNCVENLEWVTEEENYLHRKNKRKIVKNLDKCYNYNKATIEEITNEQLR